MKILPRLFHIVFFAGLLALSGGCATTSNELASDGETETRRGDRDPFERVNRAVLNFNFKVDRFALKPAAKAYAKLPVPVRSGVGNFFSNLSAPTTIVNDLLQGKLAHAGRDTGRFVVNTFVGVLGLVDAASALGLHEHEEDFGQTLAVWGVPPGPYLVLPLLGPSNLRDTGGQAPNILYTDATARLESPASEYVTALEAVAGRAEFLGFDETLELQPDKYLFLREGYRQQRILQIYDGDPPPGVGFSEDELMEELLEDEATEGGN